jgi:hypothetical protein
MKKTTANRPPENVPVHRDVRTYNFMQGLVEIAIPAGVLFWLLFLDIVFLIIKM